MIKLVAIDVNGTLLNQQNQLTEKTKAAIAKDRDVRPQNARGYLSSIHFISGFFGD